MSETATNALVVIRAALPTIIAADENDLLGQLQRRIAAHKPDPTTNKGRDEIRSLSADVRRVKAELDRLGKGLTEAWRKSTDAVNAERRIIADRLDDLATTVRAPLTEFENREKDRVASHEAAIAEIAAWGTPDPAWTAAQIAERIAELSRHPHINRDWQEFQAKAQEAARNSFNALKVAQHDAEAREAAAAEAARVAAQEAEERRQREEQERQEREARIAAEAAEAARQAAEARAQKAEFHRSMVQHVVQCGLGLIGGSPQPYGILLYELETKIKFNGDNFGDLLEEALEARQTALDRIRAGMEAQRKRLEAEEAAQREREAAAEREQRAREAAERAEQEKVAAQQAAEQRRVQAHADAIKDLRLIGIVPPDMSSGVTQQMLTALDDLHRYREWEEFASEAAAVRERSRGALVAAHNAAVKREAAEAERQRQAQAQREAEAAERSRKAEVARQEAEQKRLADEAAERERNVAHRRTINRAARDAIAGIMQQAGMGDGAFVPLAEKVVEAIAKGQVPSVKIEY